jgi:hypothetical protein
MSVFSFQNPAAYMGFVGYAQFEIPAGQGLFGTTRKNCQARFSSCNLKLKQEIERPQQAKSPAFPYSSPYFDKMIHIVQPEIIEGSLEYNVVLGDGTENPSIDLWNLAVERDYQERLRPFDVLIRYIQPLQTFKYKNCYINSFRFSAKESGTISISIDVWAKDRIDSSTSTRKLRPNARIALWENVDVALRGPFGTIDGRYIRELNVSVGNNLERFFTAGDRLMKVRDIMPKLREVEATIKLLGRNENLARYSRDNPKHAASACELTFGWSDPCGLAETPFNSNDFSATLPNVVYMIEDMELRNDVFETTVKCYSLPADKSLSAAIPNFINVAP